MTAHASVEQAKRITHARATTARHRLGRFRKRGGRYVARCEACELQVSIAPVAGLFASKRWEAPHLDWCKGEEAEQ